MRAMADPVFQSTLVSAGLGDASVDSIYAAWHACVYASGVDFDALCLQVDQSNTAVCHFLEVMEVRKRGDLRETR